jgi:hypothetical protein
MRANNTANYCEAPDTKKRTERRVRDVRKRRKNAFRKIRIKQRKRGRTGGRKRSIDKHSEMERTDTIHEMKKEKKSGTSLT